MSEFWHKQQVASYTAGSTGGTHSCNCMGPRPGEPLCRCAMRGVIERDGRWIKPEQDLGPVRRVNDAGPMTEALRSLADATPKATP